MRLHSLTPPDYNNYTYLPLEPGSLKFTSACLGLRSLIGSGVDLGAGKSKFFEFEPEELENTAF